MLKYLLLLAGLFSQLSFASIDVDREETRFYLSDIELKKEIDPSKLGFSSLETDVLSFKELAAEVLAFRVDAVHLFKLLEKKIEYKEPYNGRELRSLKKQFSKRLEIRHKLESYVERYVPYLRSKTLKDEQRLVGVSLLLASMTQLIDGYRDVLILFYSEDRLRRVLREQDPTSDAKRKELKDHLKKFENLQTLFKKIHALRIYDRRKNDIETVYSHNKDLQFLSTFIQETKSYKTYISHSGSRTIGEITQFYTFKRWLKKIRNKDALHYTVREVTGFFSKLFGNAIGSIQLRRGKLFNNRQVREKIKNSLQPFDIIFEKTPFRLTDHFIPGHWGHVAIWIGNKWDLKVLDLWDHPLVQKYRSKIKSGRSIVEALRPGVQINSLKHFMDVDDFAIIRNPKLSLEEVREGILVTLEQIGKEYDFNFDVETQNSLVCSELIYLSYPGVEWNTSRHLGRWDIVPDDIAYQSVDDGAFDVLSLFHNGKEITENLKSKMKELLSY